MFDKTIILTCFRDFLGCPRPYLTRVKDNKNVEGAKCFFVKDVIIGNILTKVALE